MNTTTMIERLPGLEAKTRRPEAAAFACLAASALTAIALAGAAVTSFVEQRNGIIATLSGRARNATLENTSGVTLTNATNIESKATVKADPNKV